MVKIPRFVGVKMCEEKPKSRKKEKETRRMNLFVGFAARGQNVQSCIACRA